MKVIYINKKGVQQGLSFNLKQVDGCIKIGDKVNNELLWDDLKNLPRKIIDLYIEGWDIFAVISGPTIKRL